MAGSYLHAVTDEGDLLDPEDFVDFIENLGDAYEMAEEMFGMIWWLAARACEYREEQRRRDLAYMRPFMERLRDAILGREETGT